MDDVGDEEVTWCSVPPFPSSNTATVVADAGAKNVAKVNATKYLIFLRKVILRNGERVNLDMNRKVW